MANRDEAIGPKTAVSASIFHCSKRCARERRRRCLPQDMVFKILLHLPSQVVHDVMKHVCREWDLMIHSKEFIQQHLQNSTCGIIIQEGAGELLRPPCQEIYVEMRRGRLEICKYDSGFKYISRTSCNGLVVAPDLRASHIYWVTNHLTKQRILLPRNYRKLKHYSVFALAFTEASAVYKVVYACGNALHGKPKQIAVLTVRVDRVWRHIDVGHPSLTITMISPVVTGGYVHWKGESFVLTLNAETETINWFPMPPFPKICGKFLPMGCNLSFIYESNEFTRDVWEMNSKTGEWTMILSFDLEPLRYSFKDLPRECDKLVIPLGWLAIREVLLFGNGCSHQKTCVAYNVRTREIQSFELATDFNLYHVQAHVNSLVWLV